MQTRARAPDRMCMGVKRVGALRKQQRERENPVAYLYKTHTYTSHTQHTYGTDTRNHTRNHTYAHTHHSICMYLLTYNTYMHTYTRKQQKAESTNYRARMTDIIERRVHEYRKITQNIDRINEKQKHMIVEQTDLIQ